MGYTFTCVFFFFSNQNKKYELSNQNEFSIVLLDSYFSFTMMELFATSGTKKITFKLLL